MVDSTFNVVAILQLNYSGNPGTINTFYEQGGYMFIGGLLMMLTVTPFFLLYPLIRFCIDGKDSWLGMALTVAVEVGLKNKINKSIEKHVGR